MNEIERAINLISEGEIDYSGIYDCELNERVTEVILNALREQAEREKGCDWCQQKHNRYLFTQIADLNAETPIACPWCGKLLRCWSRCGRDDV
jgi:hypothetical protein